MNNTYKYVLDIINNTTEEYTRIAAKDVPAGTSYKIVPVDDIPTDRTFRNAWEYPTDTL